jgi:hypothetical protein
MTVDSESNPPSGITETDTEILAVEEETPEEVESLGSALKRLAIGAAKEQDTHDKITITPDLGWSYNGVVHTIIQYPFQIEATVSAATLRKTLTEIADPTIRTTEKGVMVEEGPKKVRLSLNRDRALSNKHDEPETYTDAVGRWFRWLRPTVPTKSGRHLFPGVFMCKDGYVGQDGVVLGHVQVPGPEVETIVPMNLINVLPAKSVQLGCGETAVWAKDPTTTWICPALLGKYPDWKSVFTPHDRDYRVNRHELMAAIRLVSVTDRNGEISLTSKGGQYESRRDDGTGGAANHSEAFFEADSEVDTGEIRMTLNNRKFLDVLNAMECDAVSIRSDAKLGRLQIYTIEQQPAVRYVMMAMRGQGDLPSV